MFNEIKKNIKWNGETLELSTGKIARQASGAVIVKMGDTVVQCTASVAANVKTDANFFPFTVNYQEKTYAAGKIPGGFFKQEGKASEKEVLTSRLIDRPLRPLFDHNFLNEIQVLCTVHSFDPLHNTDILALIGASAALAISGAPYKDIAAAARVGMIGNEFVLNPSKKALEDSQLDLVVAGTKESVMMVESEANFLSEIQMLEAVKFGHQAFQPVIQLIEELKSAVGKKEIEVTEICSQELKDAIGAYAKEQIISAFAIQSKQGRQDAMQAIIDDVIAKFTEDEKYTSHQIYVGFSEVKSAILRESALKTHKRIDGRALDGIRPIMCETSIFPKTHGSALFTRGETQVIATTTLGTGQDEQIIDNIAGEYKENFLLNYIFPPYSVGEVAPLRAPSRREIGHGKLAWRALKASLPRKNDFPYTIRVVSEITECNGSSSMATICGASMSMMNAGVPLKSPIAGIAMGLIKEQDNFIILSDIIADEDYLGDMDFKVAGSQDGITALQMDIKVAGINFDIMKQALIQAKHGRIHILNEMAKAIATSDAISSHAPIVETFHVLKEKIREIIGAGGKVIKEICELTGAKIDISDEGKVSVAAIGRESLQAAIDKIKAIAIDPKPGDIFEGTVVKILDAGAFINYTSNRDGFVHISEIAHERVESVAKVLTEGQKVKVKIIGFDRGKAKLTIKNADINEQELVTTTQIVEPEISVGQKEQQKTENPQRKDVSKKWNIKKSKDSTDDSEETERKYFK
ncbi:MAG: polyribonucleotide nucleotidyltransferase [Rickettsiaceae bacterium]|nr:polyribonucleotide nucleotidyltransferase [Rickettsiaceae bacterium]